MSRAPRSGRVPVEFDGTVYTCAHLLSALSSDHGFKGEHSPDMPSLADRDEPPEAWITYLCEVTPISTSELRHAIDYCAERAQEWIIEHGSTINGLSEPVRVRMWPKLPLLRLALQRWVNGLDALACGHHAFGIARIEGTGRDVTGNIVTSVFMLITLIGAVENIVEGSYEGLFPSGSVFDGGGLDALPLLRAFPGTDLPLYAWSRKTMLNVMQHYTEYSCYLDVTRAALESLRRIAVHALYLLVVAYTPPPVPDSNGELPDPAHASIERIEEQQHLLSLWMSPIMDILTMQDLVARLGPEVAPPDYIPEWDFPLVDTFRCTPPPAAQCRFGLPEEVARALVLLARQVRTFNAKDAYPALDHMGEKSFDIDAIPPRLGGPFYRTPSTRLLLLPCISPWGIHLSCAVAQTLVYYRKLIPELMHAVNRDKRPLPVADALQFEALNLALRDDSFELSLTRLTIKAISRVREARGPFIITCLRTVFVCHEGRVFRAASRAHAWLCVMLILHHEFGGEWDGLRPNTIAVLAGTATRGAIPLTSAIDRRKHPTGAPAASAVAMHVADEAKQPTFATAATARALSKPSTHSELRKLILNMSVKHKRKLSCKGADHHAPPRKRARPDPDDMPSALVPDTRHRGYRVVHGRGLADVRKPGHSLATRAAAARSAWSSSSSTE